MENSVAVHICSRWLSTRKFKLFQCNYL